MWPSVTVLFLFEWCFQGWSTWFVSVLRFFLLMNNILLYWYATCLLIHLSCDRYLNCFYYFYFVMVMNNAMNVCMFLWTYVFISHGYMSQSGIAGSCGNSVFNCLRNYQTVFQMNVCFWKYYVHNARTSASSLLAWFFNLFPWSGSFSSQWIKKLTVYIWK